MIWTSFSWHQKHSLGHLPGAHNRKECPTTGTALVYAALCSTIYGKWRISTAKCYNLFMYQLWPTPGRLHLQSTCTMQGSIEKVNMPALVM